MSTRETATVTVYGMPLEVDFSYLGPSHGRRDSLGVPEEPDYPAEVDVEEVRLQGWEIFCLMSDEAITKTRDAILRMERVEPQND